MLVYAIISSLFWLNAYNYRGSAKIGRSTGSVVGAILVGWSWWVVVEYWSSDGEREK